MNWLLSLRAVRWVIGCTFAGSILLAAVLLLGKSSHPAPPPGEEAVALPKPVLTSSHALAVPRETADFLGIRVAPACPARAVGIPALPGSLALDPNHLARVRSRFGGEVVEIGLTVDSEFDNPGWLATPGWFDPMLLGARLRPIKFGDPVRKGQLLAVVWNKDLGEKKSDLVDALCKYHRDKETLARLEGAGEGVVTALRLAEAKQNLETSVNGVQRARRTLLSWRLKANEIQEIEKESHLLHKGKIGGKATLDPSWARVEIRSPLDGTLLEKNVAREEIVDTSADLFKIADLTRLVVFANAYEEDLPALLKLPRPISWTIHLKTDPQAAALPGVVETIHHTIDPVQRTVLVQGTVDNRDGRLRAGQYITATVHMPAADGVVELPAAALVEDGEASIVFVQPTASRTEYVQKRVKVLRRFRDVAHLQSNPSDKEPPPPGGGSMRIMPGELIVVHGALELQGTLQRLQQSSSPNLAQASLD